MNGSYTLTIGRELFCQIHSSEDTQSQKNGRTVVMVDIPRTVCSIWPMISVLTVWNTSGSVDAKLLMSVVLPVVGIPPPIEQQTIIVAWQHVNVMECGVHLVDIAPNVEIL